MESGSDDMPMTRTLGEELTLHPDSSSVTEPITGILWKIGPNKVAEWDEGFGPDVDYYGSYRGRTELNQQTGELLIKNMTEEDSGIYSVDVNGRLQRKTHKVEVERTPTGGIWWSLIGLGVVVFAVVSVIWAIKFPGN